MCTLLAIVLIKILDYHGWPVASNSSNFVSAALIIIMVITAIGFATITVDRAYSCPGTEVVFMCVVNTTVLSWDIDFLNSPSIDRIAYFPDDLIGTQLHAAACGLETRYSFNLTSKSPLTSTMTTIVSTDLYGATISCQDGFASSAYTDTFMVEIVTGMTSYKV